MYIFYFKKGYPFIEKVHELKRTRSKKRGRKNSFMIINSKVLPPSSLHGTLEDAKNEAMYYMNNYGYRETTILL